MLNDRLVTIVKFVCKCQWNIRLLAMGAVTFTNTKRLIIKLVTPHCRSTDTKSRSTDISPPDSVEIGKEIGEDAVQRHDEHGEMADDMPMEAGAAAPFLLLGFLGVVT